MDPLLYSPPTSPDISTELPGTEVDPANMPGTESSPTNLPGAELHAYENMPETQEYEDQYPEGSDCVCAYCFNSI